MFGKLSYPQTRTSDHVDEYFGVPVPDPYRWLENADDPDVQQWTQIQSDFAAEFLSGLPGRDQWRERLTTVWNYPKYGLPLKKGGKLFYTKNDGLQPQPVLYVQEDGAEPHVLLDPNTLSEDGTVAMLDWRPTEDGSLLMYATSESGLDWRTLKIRDVQTGQNLDDTLEKVKFSSAAWLHDGSGFYYSRFPEDVQDEGKGNQEVSHQVYFHKVGTPQAEDEFIYEHPELQGIILWPHLSDDGRYLLLHIAGDSFVYNRLYYREVGTDGEFIRLFDKLDAAYEYVGNDGDTLYMRTSNNAPNYRIVAVHLQNPAPEHWRDVVPESSDILEACVVVNQQLIATYMHHAQHTLKIYEKDGTFVRDIELPGIGSLGGYRAVSGNPDDSEAYVPFMSFLQPLNILRYDFQTHSLHPYFTVQTPDFDPEQYETRQVFYQSKDGTTVPMFITAKKGLELNGDNPTLLYGYGGYDISLTPRYWSWMPAWLERGGVFALANLRGGGEYGEQWHLNGMLEKKQNTFDDFISAAEWLIDNGYTSTKKLAIEGRSNGGLLVAACMVQRPDLFGAVLCHVPVIDMLRFQHFTAGRYWTSEYGDANHSKEHFDFLFAYSPLHQIKPGQSYPPLLLMTADHDDRVVPMHSKKFAAALQAMDDDNKVVIFRIETKAGHGLGTPTAKLIEQQVDVFAFLTVLFEMDVE